MVSRAGAAGCRLVGASPISPQQLTDINSINFIDGIDGLCSGLVLIGIASLFLSHVFVNSAMTIGIIPVKGLPLPFISAGGSFLISCFMMVGIVMNVGVDSHD